MRREAALLLLLALPFCHAKAQVDSTAADQPHYIDIAYNNDTFTFTDIYYTHGFRISFASPRFSNFPSGRLLLKLPNTTMNTYGVSLVQDVFTPSSITRDFILKGDRPYAAYAYAGHYLISMKPRKKLRLAAELDAGVIGPLAMGYEVQSGCHRLIDNKQPRGWENQVNNDVVLNYSLNMEKGFLSMGNIADLSVNTGVEAGTLYNNISAGATARLGKITARFEHPSPGGWHLYMYIKGDTRLVGYNATLQGGMFNRNNIYTLSARDIKRHTYMAAAGIVLSWRNIEVEHSYRYLSPELRGAMAHRWGHCRVRVGMCSPRNY